MPEDKPQPISKEMLDAMKSMLVEVIKETKKPNELEQKKLDEDKARTLKREKALLLQAQQEEARKSAQRGGCRHQTTHPSTGLVHHTWNAQVHSPAGEEPYFIPTCGICSYQVPKIKATMDQIREGVGLGNYKGITRESLVEWSKQSWKKVG